MINSIRNAVISTLNKNNYGYISIADFNIFIKIASLEIFTDYFVKYNRLVNDENRGKAGVNYAGLKSILEAKIDRFSVTNFLVQDADNKYFLPSEITLGHEAHKINTVTVHDPTTGSLVAKSELVTRGRFDNLLLSNNVVPSTVFPSHFIEGNTLTMYPTSIDSVNQVKAQYIRFPKTPKWTYITISNGTPVFDQSQPDYQDVEFDESDFDDLVDKVLLLSGMSIRELEVVNFAKKQELQDESINLQQPR